MLLEPTGDFRIDDTLNAPAEYSSPVLLIRVASNGTWCAAALRKLVDDESRGDARHGGRLRQKHCTRPT